MTDIAHTADMPTIFPTVVHMLADACARSPQQGALICQTETLTYLEYTRCVAAFAHRLIEAGARGERVAILLANSNDAAIAIFAAHTAGAQAVPLNPAYTASELGPILADAACKVVVCDANIEQIVRVADAGHAVLRIVVGPGAERLTRWRGEAKWQLPVPLPSPDALATLQYTGGTTGKAKGVNLTHRAIATNISQRERVLSTRPENERILAITPLFHVYAMAMCLHLAVYARSTLIILRQYRPDLALAAVTERRITLLAGSPTIFQGLMADDAFARTDFSFLALCTSGASALPLETLKRWEAATGCAICEGYGQTEAGPVISFNPRDGLRKPGSVGLPLPATEIEIVDVETGMRKMPTGKTGEIRVRGPQIMAGYRNNPRETADALRNGWLYTGDIGKIENDGYITILDRKKDMAIVSGFNVYPREVEEVLYRHPAVAEVAVIGEPDPRKGERLCALIVARGTAPAPAELADFCAQHLVRYKIPSEFRLVGSLPKTAVGKIDRKALKSPPTPSP
ncbi:MAG: AMP-binding protein [Betaproteobacteria bacterium]|nr:AMP-binding protein [Betaproteobacteria bacterium]